MSVEPGQTLLHYRIVEKIGEGGMGVVYAAEDTRLNRKVALKFLPREAVDDPDRRRRFEREAQAIAALNHPNIVTLHAVEECEGEFFITMELVTGRPLGAVIPDDGLPLEEFFRLAVPVVDALSAAHDQGVTHRDLKPDNVVVGADGRVRVLDFGLAKLRAEPAVAGPPDTRMPTASVSREGLIVGTVPYMSPEQAQGRAIDHRSDLFSLGILLHQMATGRRPFGGASDVEVLSSIVRDAPPAVNDVKPALPRHLGRIVRRCLAKDPERRYQRARDLFHELEDLRRESERDADSAASLAGTAAAGPSSVTAGAPPTGGSAAPSVSGPAPGGSRVGIGIVIGLLVVGAAVALGLFAIDRSGKPGDGAAGGAANSAARGGASAPEISVAQASVAVLPFVNMSSEPEDEYFSDGMTDELINALVKIEGLRVPARTSAFAFKGENRPVGEIAEALHVANVLEGSVRRSGDRLRITAQLVRADTGFHVWSEVYERAMTDIFEIQDDIAKSIVEALEVRLVGPRGSRGLRGLVTGGAPGLVRTGTGQPGTGSPASAGALVATATDDVQAYDAYLRGIQRLNNGTSEEDFREAMAEFEAALERDPEFALAWVGISDAWGSLANRFLPPHEAMPQARTAAVKALALDDTLAGAHVALANVQATYDWDWEKSRQSIRRALQLNPGSAEAHLSRGAWLITQRRLEEGRAELLLARQLDPLSPRISMLTGSFLWTAGFHEDARIESERLIDMAPEFAWGYSNLGLVYASLGRHEEAIRAAREALKRTDSARDWAFLVQTLAYAGEREEARALLDDLIEKNAYEYVCPYEIACSFVALDDVDPAIEYFEKAIEVRADCWPWGMVDPRLEDLRRTDERFRNQLRRVGHPIDEIPMTVARRRENAP